MSGAGADVADTTPPCPISLPSNGEPSGTDLVPGFGEAIRAGANAPGYFGTGIAYIPYGT